MKSRPDRSPLVVPRRGFLVAAGALAGVTVLPRWAVAGTHYAFVKIEANGTVVTGNTDITNIGGEELPRAEWIQCKRVSYGLKRDIGTGARVSGHTHYDRIEFDAKGGPGYKGLTSALKRDPKHKSYTHIGLYCPRSTSAPLLAQALERGHTVNLEMRFFHSGSAKGDEATKYMEIVCTDGRLAGVKVINQTRPEAKGTTDVEGEANMMIHYAFHQMQIDHVGDDGATSAHFEWTGMSKAD
ncbi:MAG: hypothetical protein AAF799_14350 [Myxococcota bacterium]